MKTLPLLLCWFCAAALPLLAEDSLALTGRDAPLFSGHDLDGNLWKLSDHVGKQLVFLYFYPKDDSVGCTTEACSLRDDMFALKQAGVDVAGVSFDDMNSHKNFAFKYNLDFSLLADTSGAIADAYGARLGAHTKMDSVRFTVDEIRDLPGLVKRWKERTNDVSALLWKSLSKQDRSLLKSYQASAPESRQTQDVVVRALNRIVGGPSIYKKDRFKGVSLRPATADLAKQSPKGRNLALLNRMLLEDAYPLELARDRSMDRRVSFLIGLDGKIVHVTDSPDPAVHLKELTAAIANLRGGVSP